MLAFDEDCDEDHLVSAVFAQHAQQQITLGSKISRESARQRHELEVKIAERLSSKANSRASDAMIVAQSRSWGRQAMSESDEEPTERPHRRTLFSSSDGNIPTLLVEFKDTSHRSSSVPAVSRHRESLEIFVAHGTSPAVAVRLSETDLISLSSAVAAIATQLNCSLPFDSYQILFEDGRQISSIYSLQAHELYLLMSTRRESRISIISEDISVLQLDFESDDSIADTGDCLLREIIEDVVLEVIEDFYAAFRTLFLDASIFASHHGRQASLRVTHEYDHQMDEILDVLTNLRPGPTTDTFIRSKFGDATAAAGQGRLFHWERDPRGLMALVVLLDQFPRRIFRGSSAAFRGEHLLFQIVTNAHRSKILADLSVSHRLLVCLALSHVELLPAHHLCARILNEGGRIRPGDPGERIASAIQKSRELLELFGRFPERNALLGRPCTVAEIAYLARSSTGGGGSGLLGASTSPPRRLTLSEGIAGIARRFSRRMSKHE